MNTTENNKTIAEFVEWKFKEKFNCYVVPFNYVDYLDGKPFINKICHVDNLQFHSDWNWLMEVVEKCYKTNSDYQLHKNIEDSFIYMVENRIEAVYNACVEFIKWYNEQNK